MLMKIILVVKLSFSLINCDWVLEWQDEFDDDQLDHDKWSYDKNCQGTNCTSSQRQYFKTLEGVLAITVPVDQNDQYNVRLEPRWQVSEYGRVSVMAAMPKGHGIKPGIEYEYPTGIDLVITPTTGIVQSSVYINRGFEESKNTSVDNLYDFHEYCFQVNQTDMLIMIDQVDVHHVYYSQNKTDIMDFFLTMSLDGSLQHNHSSWNCPAMLVDYVRYYRWNDTYDGTEEYRFNTSITNSSLTDICTTLTITSEQTDPNSSSTKLILIISVIIVIIVLMIVFGFIACAVIVERKIKRKQRIEQDEAKAKNIYEDMDDMDHNLDNIYQDPNDKETAYYYVEQDQDNYEEVDNYDKVKKEETVGKDYLKIESEPIGYVKNDYEMMTKMHL